MTMININLHAPEFYGASFTQRDDSGSAPGRRAFQQFIPSYRRVCSVVCVDWGLLIFHLLNIWLVFSLELLQIKLRQTRTYKSLYGHLL